jgi:hypothetical protein
MFDPARLGVVLCELAVGAADDLAFLRKYQGSGSGRTLVDGQYE